MFEDLMYKRNLLKKIIRVLISGCRVIRVTPRRKYLISRFNKLNDVHWFRKILKKSVEDLIEFNLIFNASYSSKLHQLVQVPNRKKKIHTQREILMTRSDQICQWATNMNRRTRIMRAVKVENSTSKAEIQASCASQFPKPITGQEMNKK